VHPVTGRMLTMANQLAMPNGLSLSHDGQAVIVAEFGRARLVKIDIKGDDTGLVSPFTALPGLPDNLTPTKRRTYFVAVPAMIYPERGIFFDELLSRPWLCRLMSWMTYTSRWLLKGTGIGFLSKVGSMVVNPGTRMKFGRSMILEVSERGKIIRSWHGNDRMTGFSEALQYEDFVYLGSFVNEFVGVFKYKNETNANLF